MKKFAFTLALFLIFFLKIASAQSDENRTKIQMTVTFGGKSIVTDLNGVSTSLSRTYEEMPAVKGVKDSVKYKAPGYGLSAFYLTLDAKKIGEDLLRVFAKKQNKFDGTITVIDTYGKYPTRTIKFKQASLYSYSDQLSAGSYSESYGSAAISISCQEVSINGIVIEQ
ncbi:type VI secretion system tube protein TssD [Mucilaginibacter sp.]|uniref:type VI secretion system tube protein TssD n=1 Tax=Mucilaginibacter sp. TaxID=1882438 RepID=UPI0035BBB3AA